MGIPDTAEICEDAQRPWESRLIARRSLRRSLHRFLRRFFAAFRRIPRPELGGGGKGKFSARQQELNQETQCSRAQNTRKFTHDDRIDAAPN
jgi:hypothetical protein